MKTAGVARHCWMLPLAVLLAGHLLPVAASEDVNRFNRLLKKAQEPEVYDRSNLQASELLQQPGEAFSVLPKARGGNGVDWSEALASGKIKPMHDLNNPDAQPVVMDLNIVREVKGSMPDVVFPHKEHTELLDCTNCHPGIFIPQKGANQISMAAILLGKKCGICHGKVAFPVIRCTSCHSKKKTHEAQQVDRLFE